MNHIFLKYNRYLLVTILFVCTGTNFAQSVITYDTSSPEVGSLLRVQDTSVNLYTGRPQINVPLHTIALKNYSYDIQLLYNAEGNKPDLPVGNVGLGWSATGGQIYRIANGYPDEIYTMSQYLDRTDMEGWNQEDNLYKYYNPSSSNEDFLLEPDLDEFIINIGNINASFYMYKDREGKIVTKIASQNSPYFEVKSVEIGTFSEFTFAESQIYNPYLNHTFYPKVSIKPRPVLLKGITIVDADGVTYVFGGDITSVDLSCVYFQDPNYSISFDKYGRRIGDHGMQWENFHSYFFGTPSTWHIKEIRMPNKENIKFDYLKENIHIMEKVNIYESSTAKFTLEPVYASTIKKSILPSGVNPQYYLLEDKTYDIVYPSTLKSIDASNGDHVDFVSSKRNDLTTLGYYDQWRLFLKDNYGGAMDGILKKCYSFKLDEVKTKTDTIKLFYTDVSNQRLQLDSVERNRKEVYKFQYNPRLLPAYGQMMTDNWGYYNGKSYNPGNPYWNFEHLYEYRQPDSTYVKAEILEKITYPTGGEARFEYELHTFSKAATQYPFEIKTESGVAGGVRIKRIVYSDPDNQLTKKTKEFLYQNENGTSSGILSVIPQYTASGSGRFDYERDGIKIHGTYEYEKKADTWVNWVDQFHIGYSRVTELLPDGSKTVYSFINHDQIQDEPSSGDLTIGMKDDLYHKYTSRKLARGMIQSIKHYAASQRLVKQETFTYHTDWSDYLKSINRYAFMGCQPIRVSANKIYTCFPFLQKKETTLYTDHGNISETEEYEYNKYRLLTNTKKRNTGSTDGDITETSTRYLADLMDGHDRQVFTSIPESSSRQVYEKMKEKRLLSLPVETLVKQKGKVTSAKITTYQLSDKLVVPHKQYVLESNVPLDDYSPFQLYGSSYPTIDERCQMEREYLDYDSYGNLTSVADKTGMITTYVWGYNGLYPVAEVKNARNTFKSIPRYREFRTTEFINLKYPLPFQLPSYSFHSSKAGTVEVRLLGNVGYNWFVRARVDNKSMALVQIRNTEDLVYPWDAYRRIYKFDADFQLPAGHHIFECQSAETYKGNTSYNADCTITLSYWKKESIAPETSGYDDVFYENFESPYTPSSAIGYQSSNSYVGEYAVSMVSNPEKEYIIDYQVFKDGKWNYKKHDFINNCDTIDEGMNPIDDVRVYPKNASITTYGYYPLIGLRSKTNERGISEAYKYDDFGKLAAVIDNDGNLISKYNYSYAGQTPEPEKTYYNETVSGLFTRNTCDASIGEFGEPEPYVVPAKKYTSLISQEDANQKAYNDMLLNGQQYVNEHGECRSTIILSVYNPTGKEYALAFYFDLPGGGNSHAYYPVPASRKIADTGDILKDYEPAKVYLPRWFYKYALAVPYGEGQEPEADLSIKSTPSTYKINYYFDYFPGHEDTYVIGGYPFVY